MQEYKFENSWQQQPSGLEEIINFWKQEVNESWQEEWINHVLFIAKEESGRVVGISIAINSPVKQLKNNLYHLRCYVLPAWRLKGIARDMICRSIDFLESVNEDKKCIGAFCWVTDAGLKTKKNEAIWPLSKMVYLGNSGEGHHLRVRYFKRSVI